ncbi:hypothetical protein MVEN_01814800 [Mycena venus]|uniref:Uncharacterized protein n=1 Tax=Mycena venus TaxID=2733690 RepID=A0A8H7CNC3_9AGAR|nr:hypothetical protein MVEN_01814800 [Mycena venus]
MQSPLDIPELVEHCIGFLSNSNPDLIASALVAHSWLHPAQSHLFRAPHLRNGGVESSEHQLLRLHNILEASPHLIRHVRELSINRNYRNYTFREDRITNTTLAKICNLEFTRLQSVSISEMQQLSELSIPLANALQRLLSAPSICTLRLHATFSDLFTLIQIWEHCSPAIRHLDLSVRLYDDGFRQGIVEDFLPGISDRAPSIPLQSLRISFSRSHAYDQHTLIPCALYPFVLSHLTALNIHGEWIVPWKHFESSTLQILDVKAMKRGSAIDLSLFPNLLHLRMTLVQPIPPMMFGTLATISSAHHIRTIFIRFCFDSSISNHSRCVQLDFTLSNLHPPIPITFEMSFSQQDQAKGLFPKLLSANMLRLITFRREPWNVLEPSIETTS